MREGIVDAVTLDDSILWIAGGELQPRAMFQRTEGSEVWLNYQWESSEGRPA